jgi:hypothetical protein
MEKNATKCVEGNDTALGVFWVSSDECWSFAVATIGVCIRVLLLSSSRCCHYGDDSVGGC